MFHLTPNAPVEVTLPQHREMPEADRPTFLVRALPARTVAELSRMFDTDQGRALVVVVLAGLVGWRNVRNADGSPAEFKAAPGRRQVYGVEIPRGGILESLLDSVPFDVVSAIAGEVFAVNKLDRADAGN